MFLSFHTFDDPKAEITVDFIKEDAEVISDFRINHFVVRLGSMVIYLRKQQMERLVYHALGALQELDRTEIKKELP